MPSARVPSLQFLLTQAFGTDVHVTISLLYFRLAVFRFAVLGVSSLGTRFNAESDKRLMSFAIGLASAARLFTAGQLARHYELTRYKEPEKRTREWLARHSDVFETTPGPHGEPFRRRLTRIAKRKHELTFATVNGTSQRSFHWLGYGDIWIALTQHGGRPETWVTEPDGQFDLMLLVDVTGQQVDTIRLPRNTIHVTSIEALPRNLTNVVGDRR